MTRAAESYGALFHPLPHLRRHPGLTEKWELAALLGAWLVAGSVLYRTPFAQPHDLLPRVLGSEIDVLIVSARGSRLGVLGEIAARAALSAATNVGVYICLRSPLWTLGLGMLLRGAAHGLGAGWGGRSEG